MGDKQIKKKQGNKYDENIPGVGYCRNTGNPFYFDPEDYDKIKDYTWSDRWRNGYHELRAWDSNLEQMIWMHWLIAGKEYDHKDRDPMNNRKSNLRKATQEQQSQNRKKTNRNNSGVVGVCYDKKQNYWRVYISINKNQVQLGCFINKEDAIITRLKAEAKYYGEFAPQRHLFEKYNINPSDEGKEVLEYILEENIKDETELDDEL